MISSCSTVSKVKITSSPEKAEVIVNTNDGETKSLGLTPLEVSGRDIYANSSRMSVVSINKEGFENQKIFIAQDSSQENYNINVKLKLKTEDLKSQDIKLRQEKLAKSIAVSSNLINSKKYNEAERILLTITQDYPFISVSYDLLGNIYYLRRDLKNALNFYERSFQINPENNETKSQTKQSVLGTKLLESQCPGTCTMYQLKFL
jgi:tetratricopeptide (TPR) repeat protein